MYMYFRVFVVMDLTCIVFGIIEIVNEIIAECLIPFPYSHKIFTRKQLL